MQMQVVYLESDPEKVTMEWGSDTVKKRKPLWDELPNYSGQLEVDLTGELWETVLDMLLRCIAPEGWRDWSLLYTNPP